MASGGARPGAGAKPDPNALRRDRKDDAGWTTLPASGRAGDPPAWPLDGFSDRESELWGRLWSRPQAILWERNQAADQVAMYVRCFAEAERPDAATPLRTLVRQHADALLLTIPAMLSARVRIAVDEVAERREQPVAERPAGSRSRLRAASGGGA